MEYIKASCLNLQFIFLKIVNKTWKIEKTINFITFVLEIRLFINIIIDWIKKLGYPNCNST